MKTTHDFAAERALARHCDELLSGGREPQDCSEASQAFVEALCRALPDRLQSLLVGKRIRAKAEPGDTRTADSLVHAIGRKAATYVMTSDGSLPKFVLSIDLPTSVSLTDRLFGGDGKLEGDPPETLPMSAGMALERIAAAAGSAFCVAADVQDASFTARQTSDLQRAAPFPRPEYCTAWAVTVEQDMAEPWTMQIALLESDLKHLVKGTGAHLAPTTSGTPEDKAVNGPCSEIPLPLQAILAEIKLPLARLASLAPGDVIPIAAARSIPLRLGDKTLAHGTIGTIDDRMALRLSNLS